VLLNGGVGILVTVAAVALVLGAAPAGVLERFVVSAASELEEHVREIQ